LAVAAALLALLGATMILNHKDDGRVRTVDRTTTTDHTTTTDRTTPSTSRRSATPTTGSAPHGAAPSPTGPGRSEQVTSPVPGAPGAGTSTGQDDPGNGNPTGPDAPPTAPSARATPVATSWSGQSSGCWSTECGYEVELVYTDGSLYFRRVDDVGSPPGPPDGHGYVDRWTPGDVSGTRCLATSGGVYQFPDAAPVPFIWGLAGSDIASITITIPGRSTTYTGPALPIPDGSGLRAWIIDVPPGAVERVEGSDSYANVVATITNPPDGYSGSAGC
jgi:hypothetical protein